MANRGGKKLRQIALFAVWFAPRGVTELALTSASVTLWRSPHSAAASPTYPLANFAAWRLRPLGRQRFMRFA